MQPTPSQTTDSENSDRIIKLGLRRLAEGSKNALSGLTGWQAIPAIIIGLYLVLGIFGPWLAPFDPIVDNSESHNCPPLAINALTTSDSPSDRASDCRAINILGTDEVGRDIFSRLLRGARTSLLVVLPSVFIGTMVGSVIGALVNGWGTKTRLAAYSILGLTIVPYAVLALGYPVFALLIFYSVEQASNAWNAVLILSIFSAALTIALMVVAYQYDHTCRRSWFTEVDSDNAFIGFAQQLRKQIGTLAPWIVLAALANAALAFVFLHSGPGPLPLFPAIAWSLKWKYEFEHIGILSPFVPMVLFPIGFVTFGTWWFVHHVRGRLITTYEASLESPQGVADGAEELSTEEEASHFESRASEDDGNDTLIESGSRVTRRRWMMVVIAVVVAAAVIRFGTAEAVPTLRELEQDSAGSYESARAKSWQGLREARICAHEISLRLMEVEPHWWENSEIEASQRCRDLYFQYQNLPSHRHTINYALRFLAQTLTLALVASIASAVLWTAASVSTRVVRRTVEVFVVLVALIGLTMTFGLTGWHLAVFRWLAPVDSAIYSEHLAISRSLYIVRDFAVALGISYLTIALTKPILRFAKTVSTLDVLSKWASFFIPRVLFISGFLILFHWPFPTSFIINEGSLSVIVDPRLGGDSAHSDPQDWLWTYWFALIGYAAIVFGLFAAAIWGFRRYVRSDVNGDEVEPPVSPNSPSQDAGPT